MNSIQEFRKAGNKVRVNHLRYLTGYGLELYPLHVIRERNLSQFISPRGGKIVIQITLTDGRNFDAESRCSKLDSFCKKLGVTKAIGRLNSKIEHGIVSNLVK